jgi:hypothetical protein
MIFQASHITRGSIARRLTVQLPGGAGRADDLELDTAAQGIPLQRVGDAHLELVERGR